MTICIAALYDDGKGCVLASDQMTTAHFPIGYEFEREDINKIIALNDSRTCYALLSGNTIWGYEIIEATKKEVKSKGITAVDAIADIMRNVYSNNRRMRIVRDEIESRGLDIATYYQSQQRLQSSIVHMIDTALRTADAGVQFIIAGKGEEAYQLFSITNPGQLACHDCIGYVAIGTGAPHVIYHFIEAGYKKSIGLDAVKELVNKAKERSHVAPGVGTETTLIIMPEKEVADGGERIQKEVGRS